MLGVMEVGQVNPNHYRTCGTCRKRYNDFQYGDVLSGLTFFHNRGRLNYGKGNENEKRRTPR